MYYTDNSSELINKPIESNDVNDGLYFIRVEMVDGTSQTLQISKEQAVDLGIDLTGGLTGNEAIIAASDVHDKEEGVKQVVIDGEKFLEEELVDNGNVTEYRILHPLEMNLKPLKKKDFLPSRGRFKRSMDDVITVSPCKKSKIVRTRSGRVTVPPKHIQEIYKRFIDSNNLQNSDIGEHSPILIGDFKPLRTNGEPPPLVLTAAETVKSKNKPSKSLLASQFRCTTCNKAYIGKRKMRKHLKMFPDHIPKRKLDVADMKAWDCLIDTSKMAREGKRGAKFCRELLNLLTNAKILVRYFFKLQAKLDNYNDVKIRDEGDNIDEGTGQYLMSELLAEALGIDKGWYSFNENELCKDVSIFSFLENFDSAVLSSLSINDVSTGADNNETNNVENLLTADKKEFYLECKDNLSNTTNWELKKIQENHLINNKNTEINETTDYNKKKNEEIFCKFLNDNINPETSDKINKNAIKTADNRINYALESEPFVISNKIDKEPTNFVNTVQDVTLDSNPVTLLVDGINTNRLKYRIGQLVGENLDIPPLEIFQFDSNQ